MNISRNLLLWTSKNKWMTGHVPNFKFVQKALKRFMPGETPADAINAARELLKQNIPTTFTHLGENINDLREAEISAQHYVDLIERINNEKLDIEVSLKLTQIGFDLSYEKTLEFFKVIVQKAKEYHKNVFIDIEDSSYVDKTIDFYKRIKEDYDNVGLCLQAYLYRTMDDVKAMIDINPWIRLVKGAYNEPDTIAFKRKKEVDENFITISKYFLKEIKKRNIRIAFATHDLILQEHIKTEAKKYDLPNEVVEFQMLYGIKEREQISLASQGYNVRTLISYGRHWYPWYMRRLAERPANVGFILKNILGN
ncbi:MAG: proline dehydrogenase family protein [Bacteroidetes bacterium]|nr:proline dehydrogenase family protein [Bacteroidota bacterium]